jgi:CBS domain-containing protein
VNREQKNTLLPYSLDTPVSKLFPDLFERPILFVHSDTKLIELTSYLAIGPQIYADGLLVMEQSGDRKQHNFQGESGIARRRVIGQLGSKHIISHIIQTDPLSYSNSLHTTTALDIMDSVSDNEIIELSSPISRVIGIFKEKRFAFVPVVSRITAPIRNISNPRINTDNISHENHDDIMTTIATISVRDFLPLLVKPERQINNFNDCGNSQQERTIPLSEISSKLVSVSKYDSLSDTIDLMIQRSTRNIGIRDENSSLVGIFNDRSILEFLFTHKDFVMRALHDKRGDHIKDESNNNGMNSNPVRLGRYDINNRYYTNENNNSDIPRSINSIMSDLHIIPLSKVKVKKTTTLSRAAELLTDLRTPCLILEEDSIVTPWDVVIKTADLSN